MERLVIEVEQLHAGPMDLEFEMPPKAFELEEDFEYEFAEPVYGKLTARFAGQDSVLVTGKLKTTARSQCVRCLEPLVLPLEVPISIVFLAEPEADDKARFDRLHDEDKLYYDHGVIHPVEQLREELMLVLPKLPVCGEAQKEACSKRQA